MMVVVLHHPSCTQGYDLATGYHLSLHNCGGRLPHLYFSQKSEHCVGGACMVLPCYVVVRLFVMKLAFTAANLSLPVTK